MARITDRSGARSLGPTHRARYEHPKAPAPFQGAARGGGASAIDTRQGASAVSQRDPSSEVLSRTIPQIQGSGYRSPYENRQVQTVGVVTAVHPSGFYMQDPKGDGDLRTSDGIFVRARRPQLKPGDKISVRATVREVAPKGDKGGHTVTTLVAPQFTVLEQGVAVTPVTLGKGGREMPTGDRLAAVAFWESLEGMQVRVAEGAAIAPSNLFGDYVVLPDDGRHTSAPRTAAGGVLRQGDQAYFPRVSFKIPRNVGRAPVTDVGAKFYEILGNVDYRSGDYQVSASKLPRVQAAPSRPEAVTTLVGDEKQVTIANLNALNIDPKVEDRSKVNSPRDIDDDIGDGRVAALARQIVHNLRTPDVVGLQEVQDNDGTEQTDVVDASETYRALIEAIVEAGGPRYAYAELPPKDDQEGGQPGGNIRCGYLYNPERVSLDESSLERVGEGHPDFAGTRAAMVARFVFKGKGFTVVNNHLSSKSQSTPWNTVDGEPMDPRAPAREQQGAIVGAYAAAVRQARPEEDVVVLGDFNDFEDSATLKAIERTGLVNLSHDLPLERRYDYVHRGISQLLGHFLVNPNARQEERVEHEVVHVNADVGDKVSDHDPSIMALRLF